MSPVFWTCCIELTSNFTSIVITVPLISNLRTKPYVDSSTGMLKSYNDIPRFTFLSIISFLPPSPFLYSLAHPFSCSFLTPSLLSLLLTHVSSPISLPGLVTYSRSEINMSKLLSERAICLFFTLLSFLSVISFIISLARVMFFFPRKSCIGITVLYLRLFLLFFVTACTPLKM